METRQRRALATLAAVAAGLGLGAVLAPQLGARLVGMNTRPAELWSLRIFGVRELALAYGLARAARSRDQRLGRLMAELVGVVQAGDTLLAAGLRVRGEAGWRFAAAVWLGVPPTLVAVAIARGRLPG
jgi:hypothetical protein